MIDNTSDILEQARREIAQRQHAQLVQEANRKQPWLYAFIGVSLTIILGVLLLPIASLDYRLQMIVHGVCAQAHYVTIGDLRLPLCARNTGIYAGFLSTIMYLLVIGRGRAAKLPPWSITALLAFAIVAMGVDGFNSMALDLGGYNVYAPRNELRVVTGLGMGITLGTFALLMFNLSLRYGARDDERIMRGWPDLLGAFGVAGLMYGLIFFAPAWLYFPLAIFSVVGIVGVLFSTNMFVTAMVTGLEGRVLRLRQLARPATISLVLTMLELVLLAGLRVYMEHTLGISMSV